MSSLTVRNRDFNKPPDPKKIQSDNISELREMIREQSVLIETLKSELAKKPPMPNYTFEVIRGSDGKMKAVEAIAHDAPTLQGRPPGVRGLLKN